MYLEKYHSPLKENIEKTQTDDNFMQLNIFPASHRGPFVLPTEPYGIYTIMVSSVRYWILPETENNDHNNFFVKLFTQTTKWRL